jgi:hypothetical protein
MYIARAKPIEKMEDETDFYEIIGIIKPEDAAIKKEDGKCKMEPYDKTPNYLIK